jgi:hypothetical protein
MGTMMDPSDNQAMREVLAEALRPALASWGLEEQTDALVGVVLAFFKKGYNVAALYEVLVKANCDFELDPRDHDDWAA